MNKSNKRNAGRKPKVYEEDEILNLIYSYIQETNLAGIVRYQEMYPYCLKLYEEGKISFKLSEDFWRKPGRQGTLLLKKVNEVVEDEVQVHVQDKENIVSTEDAINKYFDGKDSNKKKLIDSLRLNEVKLKKYIEQYNKQSKKINKLQQDLEQQKQICEVQEDRIKELQRILFLMMEYSSSLNFPIVNLITTGVTRTKPVEKQLKDIFEKEPTIAYDYEQFIKKKKSVEKITSINIKSKSALDDFKL